MTETMDLFEGIDLTKASLVKSRRDFPDHAILTGDRLLLQQHDPEAGALVVAVVDGKATVTRYAPAGRRVGARRGRRRGPEARLMLSRHFCCKSGGSR